MSTPGRSNFVRCENAFDVPESVCTQCLHTIVARDYDALERAEDQHDCPQPIYRARSLAVI